MSDQRVVFFPSFANRASTPADQACAAPDLFGFSNAARKFVFLHVAGLNEEILFRVIARNGICGVVDLRDRPIFRMPFFDHQEVFRYFSARQTSYFEMSYLERRGEAESEEIFQEMRRNLENGTLLIIVDDESKEEMKPERLRKKIRTSFPDAMEIHPSSLRS